MYIADRKCIINTSCLLLYTINYIQCTYEQTDSDRRLFGMSKPFADVGNVDVVANGSYVDAL